MEVLFDQLMFYAKGFWFLLGFITAWLAAIGLYALGAWWFDRTAR